MHNHVLKLMLAIVSVGTYVVCCGVVCVLSLVICVLTLCFVLVHGSLTAFELISNLWNDKDYNPRAPSSS